MLVPRAGTGGAGIVGQGERVAMDGRGMGYTRWMLAALIAAAVLSGCDRRSMADADGKLLVLPTELDFQRVPMYSGADQLVKLRNVGRGWIKVEELWVEGSDGKTYAAELVAGGESALGPSDTRDLIVKFRPTTEGLNGGVLVLRTDHPEEPFTRVPLKGLGIDAKARVEVKELDFGRIEAQSQKTLRLTFTNISDIPIEVANTVVGNDADEFTIPSFPLAGNEAKTVDVTFSPQRVAVKDAVVRVEPCLRCPTEDVRLKAEALDRAVVAEPWELDFGQVAMDRDATLKATLHNISTEPMEVSGFAFGANSDVSFASAAPGLPHVLAPDERISFDVKYTPGHQGPAGGQLDYSVKSVRNPLTSVPVRGWGGAAEICISPLSWNYGEVPVGSKNGKRINIKNCGTNNDTPLEIRSLRFGGDNVAGEDQYNLRFDRPLPIQLRAGEEIDVTVFYEPTREGTHGGYLHIETSLFGLGDLRVGFEGRARLSTDCRISLSPLQVDFGTVEPGRAGILGVKVRNDGTDVCAVKNMRLRDNPEGVFGMPGGELDGFLVYPGYYFSFMVSFMPKDPGGYAGTLQIETADPANPLILVPLIGNTQTSCLVASPRTLDFGFARPDCPPPPREVNFQNVCSQPLELRSVTVGPGTTDGEFRVDGITPSVPRTLAPGEAVTVSVEYLAQVPGMNLSPLYADVSGLDAPLLVGMLGESSTKAERTDRFTQQDGNKVDVLFVVDNTATMVEEHPKLIAAMPAFADAAQTKGVDLHVAVTTTGITASPNNSCPGGASGGEAGRFFPADNSNERMFTLASPNLGAELQQNVNVGQCAQIEQGFEAMRRALSEPLVNRADDPRTPLANDGNRGFLREEAALAVVFVGDEDDHSPDAVDTYLRFLRDLKGASQPNRAAIYAIAPTGSGCGSAGGTGDRYAEAAARTGGEVMDICASDYAPMLRNVANAAFNPQDRFPLSETPDGSGFTVRIDGVTQTSGWTWDAGTNSIVFSPMPPPGARIEVSYRKACDDP